MKKQAKKTATKRPSPKSTKKNAAQKTQQSASSHGYTIVAKASKPTFSKDMINKMMAASK